MNISVYHAICNAGYHNDKDHHCVKNDLIILYKQSNAEIVMIIMQSHIF